jgi:hypothetical protein
LTRRGTDLDGEGCSYADVIILSSIHAAVTPNPHLQAAVTLCHSVRQAVFYMVYLPHQLLVGAVLHRLRQNMVPGELRDNPPADILSG